MKTVKRHFIWFLLILLIIVRYFSSRPVYKNGDVVRITSTVFSDTVSYGDYQSFSVAGIKVYLPAFPEIIYGDRVIVEGTVTDKKLTKAKLVSLKHGNTFGSVFRKKIIDFYEQVLPQPISGLVAGVVLGSKGSLSLEFWDDVKSAGVAHVVVASGTNIVFVVSFVFGVVSIYISRRKVIPIVILSIVLYLFLSGFQPPLVRAAIMSGLTFLAERNGRLVNSWRVLFITAGIMLLIEPFWITDIGFILSFVSSASIMFFARKIEKVLHRMPGIIKESFSTSLAAQVGVAPVLFVTFGQFNVLAPIINVLVLWTVPYIMLLGALGGIIGLLLPFLGKTLLYIMYPLGWWFSEVVSLFGSTI